ncbi:transporter substrate-binding domain-containing protein [Psychrobium sp. nBUS_13]|uniref:transporter substrate-binding domain-containing protein n=1 Tax=Psychrobium sp. nBUS_13 TaxID=3395319 RepID=UPI003EB83E08
MNKSEPILTDIINKALASISEDRKEKFSRLNMARSRKVLFDRFDRNNIEFTLKEKAFLLDNPIITMTGDPNWLPYEGLDAQGHYVGIVPEMLDLFEERLGVVFKRDIGKSWHESVTMFEQGQVAMISEIFQSDIGDGTLYSNTYLSSPIVLVMRDSQQYVSDMQSVANLRLALINDYGYTQRIGDSFPDATFTHYSDIDAGLNAVATGKVDVLFATLAQASFHMASQGMNNLRIVGQTPFSSKLAFGVNKNNTVLISILNKALLSVSDSEKQAIIARWGSSKFVSHVDYALDTH